MAPKKSDKKKAPAVIAATAAAEPAGSSSGSGHSGSTSSGSQARVLLGERRLRSGGAASPPLPLPSRVTQRFLKDFRLADCSVADEDAPSEPESLWETETQPDPEPTRKNVSLAIPVRPIKPKPSSRPRPPVSKQEMDNLADEVDNTLGIHPQPAPSPPSTSRAGSLWVEEVIEYTKQPPPPLASGKQDFKGKGREVDPLRWANSIPDKPRASSSKKGLHSPSFSWWEKEKRGK
ncbi:hypothetical protein BOTBODRAFT_288151 [Botryobasidium botryosum FD-172 SS1]|uniref:Uncharacterized protein n=1 Tax=Botryobasidium botryosum (strain FD-172 SS1) TaxID=930990 RepID=A0A067M203_BOTB1|nr:hypothetical protein BOTBODRAFT_288151 [Botryobasidium botryosum FD-172 SS1]